MTEQQVMRRDVLRAVIRTANRRRDGILPMEVAGVQEIFHDEDTLLAALRLHWFAGLNGRIERSLDRRPEDREATVVRAWATTVRQMPGVRAVLDRYAAEPSGPEMAADTERAISREHVLLARAAGHEGERELLLSAGALLEEGGRASLPSLRSRLKAVLAA